MWERFSYYGMRAAVGVVLGQRDRRWRLGMVARRGVVAIRTLHRLGLSNSDLGWHRGRQTDGTPNRGAVWALLMTCGHASMALETKFAFYSGLALLIVGNGFFKPNISSIVGQLYADHADKKKDAAYTIFYMGVNSGAFLGIMLCGYVGEKVGWSFGFGLAGVFMLLGMVMFYLGQSILGEHGTRAKALSQADEGANEEEKQDPIVVRDRLIVIGVLSFFTIFFWMAFEQAGGSMTIFAKDYTGRTMSGIYASMFFWTNTALTIVPLAVVTYVLAQLVRVSFKSIPISNLVIMTSFVIVWGIALWMLSKEFQMRAIEVSFAGGESGEVMRATLQHDAPLEIGQSLYLIDMERKGGAGKLKIITQEQADEFEGEFAATVEEKNRTRRRSLPLGSRS
ncbi:MAG: MFS transporter [Pirellulaceae bacterium]